MDEDQHAFVTYTSLAEAQAAARATTGALLSGQRISANVEGHLPSTLFGACTIKVENLARKTTEDTLEEVFGFGGEIEVVGITIKVPAIGSSFAYVYYPNKQAAMRAVSENDEANIDDSIVKVKSHELTDALSVECEPLVVRILTSPDRPEYSSQLKNIETSNLVKISPMKDKLGFHLLGNKEGLEAVKSHLELIVSKLQDRMSDKSFSLPYSVLSAISGQGIRNQITKLEREHCVEFLVFQRKASKLVNILALGQNNVKTTSTAKESFDKTSTQTEMDMHVHGLKETLEQAIADLKDIFKV